MVKFVSYDGAYPNLCSGKLIVEINGEIVDLGHCLCSGGRVWFDSEWDEHVDDGPWTVYNIPKKYKKYEQEIEDVVNENVPWGCCGGCI